MDSLPLMKGHGLMTSEPEVSLIDRDRQSCENTPIVLSLVVPTYNEAETVALFVERVESVFHGLADIQLEYVFINDGSYDGTLEILLELQRRLPRIKVIDLSRNF